jgi:hypothetical protein
MFQILTLIAFVLLLVIQQVLHARQIEDLTLEIKAATPADYVMAKKALRDELTEDAPDVQPKSLEDIDPEKALQAARAALEQDDREMEE